MMMKSRSRFYVLISVLMTAIVIVGFWPTYFGPLLRGITARPWILQLHGVVFVGWMVLLLTQVVLAARGRVGAHRKVGSFGIFYGFLVLALGLVVSVAAPVIHLKAGDWNMDQAAGFLLIPLGDMALFGTLFVTAVVYRNRPEIHKRFILAATVALLFAAVGRMAFIRSEMLSFFVWLSPLLIAMAYDGWTRRGVHGAYFIALGVLLVGFSRVFFAESEICMRVGRAVLQAFTS
jgi:hypothetical protein